MSGSRFGAKRSAQMLVVSGFRRLGQTSQICLREAGSRESRESREFQVPGGLSVISNYCRLKILYSMYVIWCLKALFAPNPCDLDPGLVRFAFIQADLG